MTLACKRNGYSPAMTRLYKWSVLQFMNFGKSDSKNIDK